MSRYFVRWLITSLAVLMVPHLISGVFVDGLGSALAMGFVLGLLNLLVRPVLILITLPLSVLTLGFFVLIINALLFQWAGALVEGFRVDSFGAAFLASIFVTIVTWVLNFSSKKDRPAIRWQTMRGAGRTRPPSPGPVGRKASATGGVIEMEQSNDGKWE